MSTNRFKSNVLNRFLNTTNTNTNNTESSNDREQTGGFVRDNFSVFRRQGNNTTNNALSSISSITTAALSLIKTNKTQVNISSNQHLDPQMDTVLNIAGTTSRLIGNNNDDNVQFTNLFRVDKKLFEKLHKLSEKILKYCQSERMNLINSPPYIIDILPDICQVLSIIQITYESKMHVLNDIEFFNIFSKNLLEKLMKIIDLFKQSGKRIYDELSDERAKLTKLTLILSHMLAEMKSLFPKDVYEGQSFRIAKQDASDFWRGNFGNKTIVAWHEFEKKLNRIHKISNPMESVKLRETIQLTESKHVSIFEFDIFTRLFQPWNNLLNNWKFLATEHPAYSAFVTYDEVHKRLLKFTDKPGSYLYRLSCTKLGQWAIGYVTHDHKILQTIPQSLVQALIDGHKQNLYVYPNGENKPIDISSAIAVTSASRIQCSKEQYDMYCDMGTSFQLCKICSENNKDRKLEPCGHLICSTCLENWQEHNNVPSCPFCRCEIKTFEPIIINPFDKNKNKPVPASTLLNTLSENLKKNEEKSSYLNDSLNDCDEYLQQNKSIGQQTKQSSTATASTISSSSSSSTSFAQSSQKMNSKAEITSLTNEDGANSDDSYSKLPDHSSSNLENLQNAFNNINFNSKDQAMASSRVSLSNISPPVFPPPQPPTINNLNPPAKPAPPLPLSKTTQQPAHSSNVPIVKAQDNPKGSSLVTLKIENNSVLDHLVLNYGFDRTKVACALLLSNNDIKLAIEILQKY